MAKAPVPGLAKTRLAPALGFEGAAAIALRLLQHAVAQAVAAGLGPVTLWAAPDTRHPVWAQLQAQHRLDLHARHRLDLQAQHQLDLQVEHQLDLQVQHQLDLQVQGDGDIGQRMAHVFERAQAQTGGPLLLMGTDLPGLSAAVLREAAAALAGYDAVLVPALDGGYGLIGLHRPAPGLFDGVAWSTPQVMAQTRERLAAAGLRHAELPPLADIDEPADLLHLPAGWLPPRPAPGGVS